MVACISPSFISYEETVNTLKYANRAKNIKKKVEKNIKEVDCHISEYKDIIENMKNEINHLQKELKFKNSAFSRKCPENQIQEEIDDDLMLELGQKFFENLQHNFEIMQSITELRDLETQNDKTMKNQIIQLTLPDLDIEERERINLEIKTLKVLMSDNERLKNEMEICLKKNIEEKTIIQEHFLRNNRINQINNGSEDTAEIKRKLRLAALENIEFKKQFTDMAKEKAQTEKKVLELEAELKKMEDMVSEKDEVIEQFKEIIHQLSKKLRDFEKNAPDHKKNLSLLSEDEIKTKIPSQFMVQNIKAHGSLLPKDLGTERFPENTIEVSIVEDCLNDLHLSAIPIIENQIAEDLKREDIDSIKSRNQTYIELLAQHQKNLKQINTRETSPNGKDCGMSNAYEKIPLFIENKSEFLNILKDKESNNVEGRETRFFRKQPKKDQEESMINLPEHIIDVNQGNPKYYTQVSRPERENKSINPQCLEYASSTVVAQRGNVHSSKTAGNSVNRQNSCAILQQKGNSEQVKGYCNIQKERSKKGEGLFFEEEQQQPPKEGLSVETSLHLLNLDEIRGKLRNFKKQMNNLKQDITVGKREMEDIMSGIKYLLEDYEHNKYNLAESDLIILNSLKAYICGVGQKSQSLYPEKTVEDRRTCSVNVSKRRKIGREPCQNENQEPESSDKKNAYQKPKIIVPGMIQNGNARKVNQPQTPNLIANLAESNSYSQQARKRTSKSKAPEKRYNKDQEGKILPQKVQPERKKSVAPEKSQYSINENIINFAEAIADYDSKGKQTDQVQTVIQRQKLQMKEEMEKFQKQNQLRNYAQNILGTIYGSERDSSFETEFKKQNDDNFRRDQATNEKFVSLKDF